MRLTHCCPGPHMSCNCRLRRRPVGHASEGQRDQEDHAGLSGGLGPIQLSRRQPEAGRLCHGYLPQDRGCREEAARHARHRRRYPRRDVVNRIPLMVNGTLDLHCSATTNNADRQKQVAFTNTHFLSATRFAAKKAAKINTIDDLKGKAVTAVAGSVNLTQLAKVNTERNLGINMMPAKDQAEAFLLLETDRAQAYALDDVQLAVAIARSKEPAALHDQRGDVLEAGALRDHAAAGRRAVQGARPIARPPSSTRARRSRSSTRSGWNCRRRRTASTTTSRCRRPCATPSKSRARASTRCLRGELRRGLSPPEACCAQAVRRDVSPGRREPPLGPRGRPGAGPACCMISPRGTCGHLRRLSSA